MKCVKIFSYVLLALLFISTVPYAAEAGAVQVYPEQFKFMEPSDPNNYQTPSHLYGDGGDARYCAVVKLPAGKTVTRVIAYHSSYSPTSTSYISLYRCKFGVTDEPDQIMAIFSCVGNTGRPTVAFDSTDIYYPTVKSKFRYWLEVKPGNGNRLHGVKVKYE